MRLHGGDHDPVGQVEVAAVEAALEHDRPLHQVHDLVELPARIGPGPGGVEAGHDRGPPLARVGHRPHRAQVVEVRRGGADGRMAALVAVAEGRLAALEAGQPHRRDVACRASPRATGSGARSGRPPTASSSRTGCPPRGRARSRARGRPPASPRPSEIAQTKPSRRSSCDGVEAVLAREPGQGLVGRVGPRPARLGALGRALRRQAGRDRGQAPRRDVDPPLGERRARPGAAPPRAGPAAGPRPGGRPPPAAPRSRSRPAGQAPASSTSRYRPATACASRRMRRM